MWDDCLAVSKRMCVFDKRVTGYVQCEKQRRRKGWERRGDMLFLWDVKLA